MPVADDQLLAEIQSSENKKRRDNSSGNESVQRILDRWQTPLNSFGSALFARARREGESNSVLVETNLIYFYLLKYIRS